MGPVCACAREREREREGGRERQIERERDLQCLSPKEHDVHVLPVQLEKLSFGGRKGMCLIRLVEGAGADLRFRRRT